MESRKTRFQPWNILRKIFHVQFKIMCHRPAFNEGAVMFFININRYLTCSHSIFTNSFSMILNLLSSKAPSELRKWFSSARTARGNDLGSSSERLCLLISRGHWHGQPGRGSWEIVLRVKYFYRSSGNSTLDTHPLLSSWRNEQRGNCWRLTGRWSRI